MLSGYLSRLSATEGELASNTEKTRLYVEKMREERKHSHEQAVDALKSCVERAYALAAERFHSNDIFEGQQVLRALKDMLKKSSADALHALKID